MSEQFFRQPILNSPYSYPSLHWELDAAGQPTQNIVERRRRAEFVTPIPKAKQTSLVYDEVAELGEGGQRTSERIE
jgi:type III restriction enzyme